MEIQIFNEVNARKPDEMNVFTGVTKNPLFTGVVGTTFILQVIDFWAMDKILIRILGDWLSYPSIQLNRSLSLSSLENLRRRLDWVGNYGWFHLSLVLSGMVERKELTSDNLIYISTSLFIVVTVGLLLLRENWSQFQRPLWLRSSSSYISDALHNSVALLGCI